MTTTSISVQSAPIKRSAGMACAYFQRSSRLMWQILSRACPSARCSGSTCLKIERCEPWRKSPFAPIDTPKPMLEEGQFGHDAIFEYEWPVELGEFEDFSEVLVACRYAFERPKSAGKDCRTACAALRHRYGRLLDLCVTLGLARDRRLDGLGRRNQFSPALTPTSAWINVRDGDLLERTSDGKFFARWTGLSFLDGGRAAHGAGSLNAGDPAFHQRSIDRSRVRVYT